MFLSALSWQLENLCICGFGIVLTHRFILFERCRSLFWCEDSYLPKIFKADIDGKNISVFVKDRLMYPTSLAVDLPSQRLFWSDLKKHSIESVTLGGTARVIVYDRKRDPSFLFPSTIDVLEGHLYCIMKYGGKLFKINKFGLGNGTVIKEDIPKATNVKLFHENRQLPTSISKWNWFIICFAFFLFLEVRFH